MAASTQDFEYNKPGAERLRRRRGEEEDDDLESDLEGDLLEEDWLSAKKNPSEASDEELNDDLLQSDDEDINMCGQNVSLNATVSLGTSYDQGDHFEDAANAIVNLGMEDYEERNIEEGDYQEEGEDEHAVEYSQGNTTEEQGDQMEYTGELGEVDEVYQDEVLDIQINEPIDNEFQDDDFSTSYTDEQLAEEEEGEQQEDAMVERGAMEDKGELTPDGSQVHDLEEGDNEQDLEEEGKEESDEEDEDDEESGRLRFKTERKDVSVVRLADAESKRRNIPETLELSEEAKADLLEFEERERQKKMGRFGGRGRGGGRMGGWHGGARGRGGFPGFGMGDFRGDCGGRGRMNSQRLPLMTQIGMQAPSRMSLPHHQQRLHQQQQQRHHAPGPRGPPPFQEHGGPLAQQPLQPLISPHMAHRSPPLRAQMEPPLRMMSPPPANHQQQQPPQPKNIHINPHFRGPASSPAQVPLMPPTQSQPRPAVGPQRFPGPGDFQQHMPSNFGQQQRPPHHMEPWRNQPPPPTQDRDTFFIGEPRFPGQHMFNHQSPAPLINNNNNPNQQHHQLAGQGHMGFGHPGPGFNHSGSQLSLFQREPPRPSLPPQGHQGMAGLNQHGGAPNQPFMGSRQPFPQQQGNPFPPPQIQFGMQGLMHGPPPSQLQHHEPPSSHPPMHQQHHRPDLSQHRQLQHPHQGHAGDQRPMMHHAQNPFHQQQMHGSPRQMPLNAPQRTPSNRPRMSPPVSKQQMQILPQRNSNLRELPIAPGNTNVNNVHPSSAPAFNFRPVARAAQGVRPGQNVRPVPTGGRGRGQAVAKAAALPGPMERTVVRKEIPKAVQQDPDEDEETRQYRMKIEEQKRLREEILKKKEMRRQMQAGVRKKELLERITGQGPSQNPAPPPQPIPLQLHLQPSQQQQQRPFLPKPQQPQVNPQPGTTFPPGGTPQPPQPRPNVKTRLQMAKGGHQQPNNPGPGQNQPGQWQQQQQNQQQQRRNNALQNPIRPGAQFQSPQAAIRSIPMQGASVVGPGTGQTRAQGAKPGAKRTVMQRSNSGSGEVLQVPQKVRVVKLLGGGGDMQDTCGPTPQQSARMTPQVCQSPLRKVTIANTMDQQPQGPGMANPVSPGVRGGMANPQNNRVVVSSRGRGRGVVGAGGGPMGRGRGMPTRQNQRSAESQACTVSIDGLSSSTTDIQLKNLLNSIGPIQMFKMLPQQRRAIAKFASPQHALSFQVSFNRHMIDLSHIDVSLIDD